MISILSAITIKNVLYVVLAFCILLFMVTIHEFGHYTAGKLLGFTITEFSIGMGPQIFSKTKKNGEKISLRLLPLGGYCAFDGENDEGASEGAFYKQKPWKRLIVLFAGVFFNFLSAVLITAILFVSVGAPVVYVDENVGNDCVLEERDIIYSVNGHKIYFVTDIAEYADGNANDVVIIRNNSNVELEGVNLSRVVPGVVYDADYSHVASAVYRLNFLEGFKRVFGYVFAIARVVLTTLGGLFTGSVGLDEIGGPVTTISMTAEVISYGFISVTVLFIFMSVNLALFNLLPIPALDGCQMLFTVIEWIIGRPLNQKVVNAINSIGLLLLLGFVIFVDVIKWF